MKNLRLLIAAIVVTAALMIIGAWIDRRDTAIIFWSVSALPIAALFYSVRRKTRVIYGLVEMAAAIAALYFLFLRFDVGQVTAELIAARTVAIMAVVYVMVPAFDNIGEGLRPGSPLEHYWTSIFPKTVN